MRADTRVVSRRGRLERAAGIAAGKFVVADEMTKLLDRFEKLWMDRNRLSEIRITRTRFRKVISALEV